MESASSQKCYQVHLQGTAVKISRKGRGLDLCGRSGPSITCSLALVSEAKGSKHSDGFFQDHIGQSLLGSCLAWDKVFYPLRAGRHYLVPVFPAPTSTFLGPDGPDSSAKLRAQKPFVPAPPLVACCSFCVYPPLKPSQPWGGEA